MIHQQSILNTHQLVTPNNNHSFLPLPSYPTFDPGRQMFQAELRKKIQNYSFVLADKIGKGYSSTVYKGVDDLTGILLII